MNSINSTSYDPGARYAIDSNTHEWRPATAQDDPSHTVAPEDRRYRYQNGQPVADRHGPLDSQKRYAYKQNSDDKLASYTPGSLDEDSYDVRENHYPLTANASSIEGNEWDGPVDKWQRLAEWAAQRFLDLMGDTSGSVTEDMKAALVSQAIENYGPDGLRTDFIGDGKQTEITMMSVINAYRKSGKVNWYLDNQADTRKALFHAIREFTKKVDTITSRLQPPTPGKKEADALMSSVWGGTLIGGATNRFDMRGLLFEG